MATGDGDLKVPSELVLNPQSGSDIGEPPSHSVEAGSSSLTELPLPIPINIHPATPDVPLRRASVDNPTSSQDEKGSSSAERVKDMSKGKRVQVWKNRAVNKGQSTITNISKKIGNGVVRSGSLRRFNSTPGELSGSMLLDSDY